MGTFGYTTKEKVSIGNRVGYIYVLTNVQTDSTSIVYTPFKKITGYAITTNDNATSCINVASNTASSGGTGKCAYLTLDAGEESNGEILVVGLL